MPTGEQIVAEGMPKVLVLMATYNGERYLSEQIESILGQKDVNVSLLITDDCSTDGSYELARKYSQADSRVISMRNETNVGVGMNFLNMLYAVPNGQYDYVAFSDQDDVWLDDKLAIACNAIKVEAKNPEAKRVSPFGIPVLYCSDLQNVNADLVNAVPELRALNLSHDKRATPLIRNFYSGCTMVMNQSMVSLFQSNKLTEIFRIHDAWLALVARYCGNLVIDLDNARILRRIAGQNVEGAITPGRDLANSSIANLKNKPGMNCSKTARQLYEYFGHYMSEEDAELISSFASYSFTPLSRIRWAMRMDYCGTTFVETMSQKVKFLLGRF